MAKITEGYMPFKGFKTYYRIVGERQGTKKPLIFLHGGPGSTHNYFEVLDRIADEDNRQLIMYDQIGCGHSMVTGHPELFTGEIWLEELIKMRKYLDIDECHILGQSWGGMQAIWYLCVCNHKGVKSAILSSTLPYNEIWEREQHRRIKYLPKNMQDAIAKAEKTGNFCGDEYTEAINEFMLRHCADVVSKDSPECLRRPKVAGTEAYTVGWGPNEFTPTGTLKNYNFKEEIRNIKEPCLIMSGQMDMCSPFIAKEMFDKIPNSQWELFEYSRHMCFVEENDKYVKILKNWLNKND